MLTKKQQYEKAMNILAARKQKAVLQTQMRRETVIKKIPELIPLERQVGNATIQLSKLILSKAANASEIIPKIMHQNLSMQEKIGALLASNGFPADYLKVHYFCEKCNDSGFIEGERCECLQALLKKIAVDDFNETAAIYLCNFHDFKLHYYNKKNKNSNGLSDYETMSQIYRFCLDYANSFHPESPSILMMGSTGLGKTHLSLAIANEAIKKNYHVLYGSTQDFFVKIQNEFFGKSKTGEDTTSLIANTDLLVLDDLGAEYESSFNASTFYNLINSRLSHKKPTIISTNLSIQELQDRYSNRVVSRLISLYKTLRFVGKDIRQMNMK